MNEILTNIEKLYEKYGDKITSYRYLLLLYWKVIDKVPMPNGNLSVQDFINNNNITDPRQIIEGKYMLDLLKKVD